MPLHCKIGAEVIALNEKQLQEMEQKAYDNGLFVSKLSKADAETAVRKIYAVFKNQGFDYIIINDEGMFRFNGDRLRFAELIADVGELEHGNKYERRLTPYEYDFLRGYVEYGKFALARQSDDIEHPKTLQAGYWAGRNETHPLQAGGCVSVCAETGGIQPCFSADS